MPYPVYGPSKHSVVAKRYQSGDGMRKKNATEVVEVYGDNPAAATRMAIVRCTAAIGSMCGRERMETENKVVKEKSTDQKLDVSV